MTQTTQTHSKKRLSNWLLKLRGNERAISRAKLLIDRGAHDDAIRFLDHSAEVFKDCSKLKSEAAHFLYGLGEYPMAIEWLRRGGIAELNEQTAFEWSRHLEGQGELKLSIQLLELFLSSGTHEESFDPSETHFRIARSYRLIGEKEAAVEHVSLCLETGNYPNVLSMLCSMRTEPEKSLLLDRVDRIKKTLPIIGHFSNRLHFALSDIYQLNDDYANSAHHLGKARDGFTWNGQVLTEGKPLTPSFLLIGTMKSGTTAFYHTLCQHPHVYEAIRKEVRYFDNPKATDDWFFAHFPRLPKGQPGITGEATPNYYAANVHERIRKTLPGVKLICLMRDPASRAVSQYFHGQRHGAIRRPIDQFFDQKTLDDLSTKSDRELEQIAYKVGDGKNIGLLRPAIYGLYVYYLKKWFREFDKEQILLLTLEEFSKNKDETIARTCRFLGIDPAGPLELTKPHKGIYESGDEKVQEVLERLRNFYEAPNRKLYEEFGIQF